MTGINRKKGVKSPFVHRTVGNRMLTYNGYPLTYDDNGNLTQRQTPVGTVTYNWDSKNQLISINGPNGTASFKYDAQGRRIEKRPSMARQQASFMMVHRQ